MFQTAAGGPPAAGWQNVGIFLVIPGRLVACVLMLDAYLGLCLYAAYLQLITAILFVICSVLDSNRLGL